MPFGNPILSGETLNRTSMQSQDYVPGVSGWAIYRDGSAEFNDIIARGIIKVSGINGSYVLIQNDTVSEAEIQFYPGTNAAVPVLSNGYIKANNQVSGTYGYSQVIIRTPGYSAADTGAALMFLTSQYGGTGIPATNRPALFLRGDPPYSDGGQAFQFLSEGDIEAERSLFCSGNELGKGNWSWVASSSSSAAVTAETAVLTIASATYKAGRAYRVRMMGGVQPNTANTYADFRVKKASTAGATIAEFFRYPTPVVSIVYAAHGERVFIVGAADVTTSVVLTLQTPTGTQTHFAAAGAQRQFEIQDIGPATYYAGATTLT